MTPELALGGFLLLYLIALLLVLYAAYKYKSDLVQYLVVDFLTADARIHPAKPPLESTIKPDSIPDTDEQSPESPT
jgi:hypothetical protein